MSESGESYFPTPRILEPLYGDQTGFSKNYNESQLFRPLSTQSMASEYKISFPPSMETQIRKLKLSMEPWREVILEAYSILLWQKQWHSTALLAGSSTIFMIVWLCNPNVLTVVSLLGLAITLADYFMPMALANIFKSETWNGEKQKQYEEICTNIILYKTKAELIASSYWRMRVTNPKLYIFLTISTLSFMVWIGGTVENLFLTYLFTTTLLMLPGMQHHGMLSRVSETIGKLLNDLVENAKSTVAQKKVQ